MTTHKYCICSYTKSNRPTIGAYTWMDPWMDQCATNCARKPTSKCWMDPCSTTCARKPTSKCVAKTLWEKAPKENTSIKD